MIMDILLTIGSILLNIVSWILPKWTLPESVFSPFVFFYGWFYGLFPDIASDLLLAIILIIGFEFTIMISRLSLQIVNWFRGSGEIKI